MKRKYSVVVVICIFISVSFIPSINSTVIAYETVSVSSGNTLYVGGNGTGNYSNIQDAIDNASDGDTVFVYDDSSPYYENVIVDKSISLIGENKDKTIIDGGKEDHVIYVSAEDVTVTGFTIQKSQVGITLYKNNYTVIYSNIIKESHWGIQLYYSNYNQIFNNTIIDNKVTGFCPFGMCNEFRRNYISGNDIGIWMELAFNNDFSYNTITNNKYGILASYNHNNTIYQNNITNNEKGLEIEFSSDNKIIENNFIDNDKNVFFRRTIIGEFFGKIFLSISNEKGWYIFTNLKVFEINDFDGNYWGESRTMPYFINGRVGLIVPWIPWIIIDWHPAKEPYDI